SLRSAPAILATATFLRLTPIEVGESGPRDACGTPRGSPASATRLPDRIGLPTAATDSAVPIVSQSSGAGGALLAANAMRQEENRRVNSGVVEAQCETSRAG